MEKKNFSLNELDQGGKYDEKGPLQLIKNFVRLAVLEVLSKFVPCNHSSWEERICNIVLFLLSLNFKIIWVKVVLYILLWCK